MVSPKVGQVALSKWYRVVLLLLLVTWAGKGLYAQVADRAVITGIVTDSSGAAVPDAVVNVTNQDTGSKIVVGSNSAGNYSTPPLILGTYTVEVIKEGFKGYSRTGLSLSGGQTYRQDVELQLGVKTETVEVKATVSQINTETPTVSHTIGQSYYQDLPAVMGADIRLAESLLQLQPGYIPMQPNGDAIFRGSQFTSRINGGQTMATENWFDGAAFGYAEGHQQTQESSVPYTSVKEMTVVENTFSAQYGHTSGGFITYTTKSGTNELHGSVYDYFTNRKLNARKFFLYDQTGPGTARLPLDQMNYGFDVGGPVPKVTKWGKTFWFVNMDYLNYKGLVNTGFVNTIPTPNARAGNFSDLLDTTNQVGTDALGRPIFQGEVFNPATTRLVGGVPVRDGYGFDAAGNPIAGQANIIPANDPLRSSLAATVVPNIQPLDRNTLRQNVYGGTSDDNNKLNVHTWLFRIDHTFNDKFSISNTFFKNWRPRTAHCGGPGGCNTVNDGQLQSAKNDTYIGQGFYQLITNHFEHLQMNWVLKPNVFNHTTLAYDRWVMNGNQLSAGVGWNQKLGLGMPNDPTFNNAGFPSLNFQGPIGYTSYGTPWRTGGSDINNRYQLLDDVTWITGKHTIKAGIEYRYMNYPQTGWAVNTGGSFGFNAYSTSGYNAAGNNLAGNTGNEFASFILGQVNNANFSVPFNYMPKNKYFSPWVNDDFKLTPNLTLTFGIRFDWQSGLSEQHGRFATFDPNAQNPVGHLGATVFGNQANGDSSWSVGPRFGFAYRLGDKSVIRGGYGMYYAGAQADSWDPYPVDGQQTNPNISNSTGGLYPTFYFNGNNACPAQVVAQGVSCGWPAGSITLPPNISAAVSNGGNPVGVDPRTYTMPRYQNWSLSFQRQLTSNMALDVAYVGNHGTRLIDGRSSAGVYDNMNPASVLALGQNVLQNGRFSNGTPNAVAAGAGFNTAPYPTFSGTVAQSLRSWPQYQQINWRYFPNGWSRYNALQVSLDRRMEHGLQVRVAYTYSHLVNNGSETGLGSGGPGIQNPSDMSNLNTVSSDDLPHILSFGWVYQLPFGKGKAFGGNTSGVVDKIIGNWQLSGVQTYQSGRPLGIVTDNSGLGPLLFNGVHYPNKAGNGLSGSFTDPANTSYLNQGGWTDPGPLAFGNAPRMDANARGFGYTNEDLSLYKDTYFGERRFVRFKMDSGNVFNRVYFCNPDTFWLPNNGNGNFGQTHSQCNIPRNIQLSLEIFF
jgi:hypothetical protein